jgi:hypothetical protein
MVVRRRRERLRVVVLAGGMMFLAPGLATPEKVMLIAVDLRLDPDQGERERFVTSRLVAVGGVGAELA